MKIVVIGPVTPKWGGANFGGIAHHVVGLAEAISASGAYVTVLPLGRFHGRAKLSVRVRIAGWNSDFELGRSLVRTGRIIRTLRGLLRFRDIAHIFLTSLRLAMGKANLETADLIHVHGVHSAALPILRDIGVKAPVIVTMHSYHDLVPAESRFSTRKAFIERNLGLADAVIHVSEADKRKGETLGISVAVPDFVVHNGLQGEPHVTEQRSGICFVGSLIERKRVGLVLQAMKFAASQYRPLRIVGDGSLRNEIESEAKTTGILYEGGLTNDKARQVMAESLVLVVPSRSESFGLVYIEALIEGASVIGYAETVEEFRRHLAVTPEEARCLVPVSGADIEPHVLARMIEEAVDWRKSSQGQQAMESLKAKVVEQFSWGNVGKKMTAVYEDVYRWHSRVQEGMDF